MGKPFGMESEAGREARVMGTPRGAPERDGPEGDARAGSAADATEHLTRDLARVRARFGVDPALAGRSLAPAWRSDAALEEDEAEFVDTLADCLGAGLSLDDALACWDTGELVYAASGDDGAAGDGESEETAPIAVATPRHSSAAHRVLVR